ncbi:hypothetical protein TTHERM_00151570 (macronuclear) [Tetrahymena thermophila SB210]|uniref:Uncharacterized protein n=1 Tax=Tetrahymena thermophila (strain SB210) TaxID=312017 RepID=I7ML99_TETTS|nr:hypothetical protein TTHERM_00151570 [Tetrahymena thermophila SB210]EAS01444.2 hypothetical protein TTHERM_00151570 [Tetrahymena thermophila SB210]|eukprot:XP_001021690.2 hypothetical protein TTHERM_00151570 [Tetrahymena thermophila SB210]
MSYFSQKPNSFLNNNSSDLRRDIAMNEIFDLKGKQNHQSSLFGSNLSQFTGSTAERSFLNLNVRDSITAENIKYQTQPQNISMFNSNIAGHNTYSQTSQLAFKQPTQQSFLNYDSFNNNNPSPNKVASMQSQQHQQISFFDIDFDNAEDGTDNFYYSSNFHVHQNELRSNASQQSNKLQLQKFKQEINGLLSNENSRQPSSRENQADYFSSNLSNKRNNFRSVDGLYENQYQQIGVYSHDNSSKAADSQFVGQQGTKNYYKFSNLVGNTSYQKPQYENHSLMLENTDDSFIFSKDKMKKNSRSSSILGDNLFSTQNQQYDLNSSYIQPHSVQNTVRSSLLTLNSNSNQSINQGFRYRTQYQNSSESKKKNEFESNSKDGGYKVGQDFAKKLRLQKCESTGDFQVSQFQQTQTKSPLSNNAKNQSLQQQNQNRSQITNADQNQVGVYKQGSQKQYQQNNSKAQTEESTIYIPTQETKSSYSTHNFDSTESAEKNQTQKEDQQNKMSQNNQFSKQWEELNSFKKNAAQEEQKSKELTEKLIQGGSTSKIDFKSIKLSRTPLQTIDIKQQLANIDQKAKLEAYGESMQPPELTKVEQFVPQLLQKNSIIQSIKTPSNQDDRQQQTCQGDQNTEQKSNQNMNTNNESIKQNDDSINDNKKKQSSTINNQKINIQQNEQKKNDQPTQKGKNQIEENINQKNISKVQQQEEIVKQSSTTQEQSQKLVEIKSKEQNKNEIKTQNQAKDKPIKNLVQVQQKKENQEINEVETVKKSKNNNVIEKIEQSHEEKNQQSDKDQTQKQNATTKNQQNQQLITQKTQNQDALEQKPKSEAENPSKKQLQINLNNNQIKQQNTENASAQNSSRQQVDIQGIVQNIRSIKEDLKQKRNNRNAQEENVSKSSANVLQTDPSSTPSFQLATQQLQEFSQINQKENNSHIESLKNEIFSDFGKKGKEMEQQDFPMIEEEQIQPENQILIENNLNPQKNKNKFQMDVIEEEIRTKNTSQEQINTRTSIMSFVQDQNAQQVEEENQIEVSFNGMNNDMEYVSNQNINDEQTPSANNENQVFALEAEYSDGDQLEKCNEILQKELSLDLIMKYQSLLNEASRASVKNLPLQYTKEMVNLAYCILQTVRNCSQIPKDSDEDQEQQF